MNSTVELLLAQLLRNQISAYKNIQAYDAKTAKEFIKRIDESEALLERLNLGQDAPTIRPAKLTKGAKR